MEDNFFPLAFCRNNNKANGEVDAIAVQKSWARRVNVNSSYYFGTLILLTLLNIMYAVHYDFGVDVLVWKDRRIDWLNMVTGVNRFGDKSIFLDWSVLLGLILQATAVYTQVEYKIT